MNFNEPVTALPNSEFPNTAVADCALPPEVFLSADNIFLHTRTLILPWLIEEHEGSLLLKKSEEKRRTEQPPPLPEQRANR